MKTLITFIKSLRNILLFSHRLSKVEKELANIKHLVAASNQDRLRNDNSLDRRLLRLESFVEFASQLRSLK